MNTFFISDTHFGHEACYSKFVCEDGQPLRPFKNADEGDFEMMTRWNSVVKDDDIVYHLGDVTLNRKPLVGLNILYRLKGRKILVKGNHDIYKLSEYTKHFEDVVGTASIDGMVLSHVPLHPQHIDRWTANIHGHTHSYSVRGAYPGTKDPKYFCVSVEQIDYTPISLAQLKVAMAARV